MTKQTITIELTHDEINVIATIIPLFMKTCENSDIEIPRPVVEDIASVLMKILAAMTELDGKEVVRAALEEEES